MEEMAFEQYVKGCLAISRLNLFLSLTCLMAHPTSLLGYPRIIPNSIDPKPISVFLLLNCPHALLQEQP